VSDCGFAGASDRLFMGLLAALAALAAHGVATVALADASCKFG